MKSLPVLTLGASLTASLFALAVLPSASLFENENVKVVRAQEKPHVKGSFHEHKVNRVMVYLQDGSQRFEYQDSRKPSVSDWKANQVVFSEPEGMHSPEVITEAPFNIVEVELKKPAAAKAAGVSDALKVDPKHYKLEFDKEQVRVLRMTLGAHQRTPSIRHSGNEVVVFLTDEDAKATDGTGKAEVAKHKAGDAVWATPRTETLENTGDQPLEMVLIELRY